MATRRIDSRIVELDDLNPTKHEGNVITIKETLKDFVFGFTVWGMYYARIAYLAPIVIYTSVMRQRKYYEGCVDAAALRKKKLRDNAWESCSDLSWPKTLWGKRLAFACQSIFSTAVGALLARRFLYRHLSPAIPRAPPAAPYPVSPKGLSDSRVH